MIKLSIITVVRNDLTGLKNTYQTIKGFLKEKEIEWIVIDGNSGDETVSFLNKFNTYKNVKWISEPDKSMYDAMNKGINLASGVYLQFLNAGDVWLDVDIRKQFLDKKNDKDIIFYNIRKDEEDGSRVNWELPHDFLNHLPSYPSVPHQSTFVKKDVFIKYGYYSEDYKYLGDYDFFARIYKLGDLISYEYRLETTIVAFICNGVTFNYRLSKILMNESMEIQKEYFDKVCVKTKKMYQAKYILSFIPYTMSIARFMRNFIKHK